MSYKSMIEDLKNDSSNRLYLFYGEEQYLIEETLYRFKRKIVDEQFEAFNYQIFNGEEFHIDAFVDACETLPFMGQNRMIVVKDLDWLSEKGKSTATKEEEEMMVNCLESLPDTTYLFFVMSKEVDHRRKIVKWVQKYGKKVEFAKLKGNEIAQWIREKVGEYGKTIEPQSIAFFLDVTGYLENNSKMRLRDLDNEIKKIVSYIGDKERIEKEDIDLITIRSTESNIFRML
ncbi:MAG TPA: DNA polymerase III subunit delta, partial [Clostridiales bacterium]|nr:DNA polymerase III subunit delta [Clostridiales bacterium]